MKAQTSTFSSSSHHDEKERPSPAGQGRDSSAGAVGITRIDMRSELRGLEPAGRYERYRELWRAAGEYRVLTDFPLHLDIELSAVCNLRCRHCFQNGLIEDDLGLMEFESYARLIDQGVRHGLCAVKLQVRGESMLHPRFNDAVVYAKKAGLLDVQVTTNATLLTPAAAESLLNSGLDGVIFSVDPHHGSNFRRRNGASDYERVASNIRGFLKLRSAVGRPRPWVRIQAAVSRIDRRSAEKMAREIALRFPGVEVIDINRLADFRHGRDAYPDLSHGYRLLPCVYPMQRLAVFWNGDVTVCCVDYNGRLLLGNAFRTSMAKIWRGGRMRRFREMHASGRRRQLSICRHCHACIEAWGNGGGGEPNTHHFEAGVLVEGPLGSARKGDSLEDR